MSSIGRSRALEQHRDLPLPVEIRRLKSARRLRLRFDADRGLLTLTCPAKANLRAALDWAAGHRPWIDAQMAAALPAEPLVPGAVIPLEGSDVRLEWDDARPRTPRVEGGMIVCGGQRAGFERRILRFLQDRALETLSRDTAEFAEAAGARPVRVRVGDAGTRWGSCSSDGRIRYSWRLILAPEAARRYVAAHEVAHLVHLDHGPDFKALEAKLYGPGIARARSLLRRCGPRLKRIGRGD
jgi:hypothetical protein